MEFCIADPTYVSKPDTTELQNMLNSRITKKRSQINDGNIKLLLIIILVVKLDELYKIASKIIMTIDTRCK